MRLKVMAAAVLVAGFSLPAQAAGAGYDDSWFREDFWSGEYPNGLSVTAPVTVMIRSGMDKALPRDIACDLQENATYHRWNIERVESDELSFVSFTRISIATMTSDYEVALEPFEGGDFVPTLMRTGETYLYLVYYGEGAYLIEYRGKRYVAYADLWEVSDIEDTESGYDEWLGLTCANGARGWLFMDDVVDLPGIEPPRIPRWGLALDLDAPEPFEDGLLDE